MPILFVYALPSLNMPLKATQLVLRVLREPRRGSSFLPISSRRRAGQSAHSLKNLSLAQPRSLYETHRRPTCQAPHAKRWSRCFAGWQRHNNPQQCEGSEREAKTAMQPVGEAPRHAATSPCQSPQVLPPHAQVIPHALLSTPQSMTYKFVLVLESRLAS
jgi:hypothetical protein